MIRELDGVFIHPLALVETDRIGPGTRVWAFAHVTAGCEMGSDCNICDHTFIEKGVRLGDRVTVKCGVYLWQGVTCEDDVFIGPNATFTNDLYPRSKQYLASPIPTVIRRRASIGASATILAGITIGECAMVAAAAVVTDDVPPYALVRDSPARVVGFVSYYGDGLVIVDGIGVCPRSGLRYRVDGQTCTPLDAEPWHLSRRGERPDAHG